MASFYLNTKYTLTLPAGELSTAGVREVLDFINLQNLKTNEEWLTLNPEWHDNRLPELSADWSWSWIVQKGVFAGTLPKRIRNYYYKTHGIKCPASFIEQIGSIARQHTDSTTVYRFEIVDEFDWTAGDFGDYGSCYWGGNAGARIMLRENGGLAICFMTDSGTGYARAWLVEIDDNVYVIFNGYGFERGVYATQTIARVFATFMALTYKKITLDNSTGSSLFINNDTGFIIGTPEAIADIDSWDFEWPEAYAETCANCGRMVDEYEGYTGADDNTYCENCFYELFDRCDSCDGTFWREDTQYIDSVHETVCDYCRVEYFDICTVCDDWFLKRELHTHEDELHCWQCLNKIASPPGWAE